MPPRGRSYSSRRRYAPRRSPRYVQDSVAGQVTASDGDTARFLIVAPANINGLRRVARMDLNIGSPTEAAQIAFALVYVPEGIVGGSGQINLSTANAATSLYVPEQHVLTSGSVVGGTMQRYIVPVGRSLASMDSIWLYARSYNNGSQGSLMIRASFLVAFA
jgi:hypothetical protein